jgi:IclR family acetate operon transcriptional repressor
MEKKRSVSGLVQCVNRALDLLLRLADVSRDLDLTELARRSDLTKSTTSRLLSTMQQRGFVRQHPTSQRFSLGPELIRLGAIAKQQLGLTDLFHPFLEQLMQATGETASLALLDHNQAVYVDQVQSSSMIRSFPPIGTHVPLHCTAVGKVLLSDLSPEHLSQVIEQGLRPYTPNTILDPAELQRVLEQVKERGFAVDLEEIELGGHCIAAPVLDNRQKVIAAMGISGPRLRVTSKRLPELTQIVKTIAGQASAELSFNQDRTNRKQGVDQ